MSKENYTNDGSQNVTDKTSMGTNKNVYEGTVINNEKTTSEDKSKTQLRGFLISYSKTELGEYWGLKEGNKNIIGRDSSCHIKLSEQTISGKHAILNIRKFGDEYKFFLTDTNSNSGTFVNNEPLMPTQAVECKNLDKIKVGNYELLLIVIDKEKHELIKSEKFVNSGFVSQTNKSDNDNNDNPYDNVYTQI